MEQTRNRATGNMIAVDAERLRCICEWSRKISSNMGLAVCGLNGFADDEALEGMTLLMDQIRGLAEGLAVLMSDAQVVEPDQNGTGADQEGDGLTAWDSVCHALSDEANNGKIIAMNGAPDLLSCELELLRSLAQDFDSNGLFDALTEAYYTGLARGARVAGAG